MFRKFAPAARVISNQQFTLIDIRQIRHHREEKTVAIAFILELPSEINQKQSKNDAWVVPRGAWAPSWSLPGAG